MSASRGRYAGYAGRVDGVVVRREVPGPRVVVIVAWGDAMSVADPRRPHEPPQTVRSFAARLADSYALTRTTGASAGVQLDLDPLAARRLLGVPMDELANRVVELDNLPGRWSVGLADRLGEQPTWADRFATLDAVVARRLARAGEPDPRVAWAWSRLLGSGGRAGVGRSPPSSSGAGATSPTGSDARSVCRRRRWPASCGSRGRTRRGRGSQSLAGWARVAHACGYYDQAHLIRDVREFAGVTPGGLSP
jgi:hypothetical protein